MGRLHDTLAALRGAGIQPVGAGVDLAAASAPLFVTLPGGVRVAVVAFVDAWLERPGTF